MKYNLIVETKIHKTNLPPFFKCYLQAKMTPVEPLMVPISVYARMVMKEFRAVVSSFTKRKLCPLADKTVATC